MPAYVPHDAAFLAFIAAWEAAGKLPARQKTRARKELADRLGISVNTGRMRVWRYRSMHGELPDGAPVAGDASAAGASVCFPSDGAADAGEGVRAGPAVPCAAPSPSRRSIRGVRQPPLDPKPKARGGMPCIPVNSRDPKGCACLLGEGDALRYCNAPVPEGATGLRKSWCAEHARIFLAIVPAKDNAHHEA